MRINEFLSLNVDECAEETSSSGLNQVSKRFVPFRRYQVKSHSSPWFSPACAAAIAHHNYYFYLLKRNDNLENKQLLKTARKSCRKVLSEAKSKYATKTQNMIASQKLGYQDF